MTDFAVRSQELFEQLVSWRRDFHQHPELGFQETRTAGIVAAHLHSLGIETTPGVGKTGVVGVIEGNGPGPTVLLRFDMDALPIQEATGHPFASEKMGIMHACGHDGHTAIGMGVAVLLAENSTSWPGRVKLLFQPAEEGLGGARATIEDGVLENPKPDFAFGLHLWNPLPSGQIIVQPGPLMAAADRFTIEIKGKGGHGAQPHFTTDAVLVGSQAAVLLHSIVSRNIPAHDTAVMSIGSFHAGEAFNVIAEHATLNGTLRTFKASTRDLLIRRMEEILAGIAVAHGAACEFSIHEDQHTPAVINNEAATQYAYDALKAAFGESALVQTEPLMVAEDMAEIINRVPGCYLLVGAQPSSGDRGSHHSPNFDFDETMLALATAILAETAVYVLHQ